MTRRRGGGRWRAAGRSPGCLLAAAVLATAVLRPLSAAAAPPALAEQVTVDAAQQQWVQDQLWCAQGDVQLHYQDISLRCDEVEINLQTMHLHA